MAHLIIHPVRQELEGIRNTSQAVKHLLRQVLQAIEENPSAFPELEVPERDRTSRNLVDFRR